MNTVQVLNKTLALPMVGVIYLYQKTLSPDHGIFRSRYPYGFCKHYPSCSMYAKQIFIKRGVLGLPRVMRRIISCNPWSLGGIDLP
ncbi:MAG: hypothetical protein A2720_04650 [Candidatus Doudnabacteria bacterium RIFCSPHIGHO2_01_FULL_46_24]|uniref:Membrane protein insertion efficiency factor n=1 Tax=Candidatus Doudnabacteria bacterium RIFCSPHIGHO2_01_FULL_46_24 TaxID=1817825 RepID=A0A1F5NT24_9BACT|nr:MAG: hypothetical protein A2720_04650 [Candidatus Doudnabacteria bacterium RIFCSPHIGHO2_01_FULL_46_24]